MPSNPRSHTTSNNLAVAFAVFNVLDATTRTDQNHHRTPKLGAKSPAVRFLVYVGGVPRFASSN